ncbi:MAG: GtrA family protein [Oscillospiraceae bacterium]
MIRRLLETLPEKIPNYHLLRNIFLYGLFGGAAALLDMGVCSLLLHTGAVEALEVASLAGNVCGFFFTFFTNTFLNFKKTDAILKRFASYGLVCLFGMGISTLFILLFKQFIDNQYVVKFIVLVLVSAIQFVLNKRITYRKA